ncbi:MAG: aminopeptidase [Burkholderiales bacterium]
MQQRLTAGLLCALLAGCADLGYYAQSVGGQLSLLSARQPIPEVIADPATDPQLAAKLTLALEIRDYASRVLRLPDNGSYRSYADLRRSFVVWNVWAASEFSVTPRQWCFLVAGCVTYRGYFAEAGARAYAKDIAAEGDETFVSGVPAYSTLGWFDDPVLNTFVRLPDYELARLIFHELAHQVLYVKDDTTFNESFATFVEEAGVKRWLADTGRAAQLPAFEASQRRRAQFVKLTTDTRARLAALYRMPLAPEAMRERKAVIFTELQQQYAALQREWGAGANTARLDAFFAGANNATLASVGAYTALVPAFAQAFARSGGDFARFYAEVKRIAALPPAEREAALTSL